MNSEAQDTILQPQHGIVRLLRPYENFQDQYNGKPADIPIMFTEVISPAATGGAPLDDNAGKPGYSANLLRGLPVTKGSSVSIWLPNIRFGTEGYYFTLTWRYRNAFDFRNSRTPYHLPFEQEGAPDTTATSTDRVIIPGAWDSKVFAEAEPSDQAPAVSDFRVKQIQPFGYGLLTGAAPPQPFIPNNVQRGQYGQGLLDPANAVTFNAAVTPTFNVYRCIAEGDELLIGATRSTSVTANWTFATVDLQFAALFGHGGPFIGGPYRYVGIYVTEGVNTSGHRQ